MSMSPEQIIKTICPELSGSPSLPVYLEMAVEGTSSGFFCKMYNHAVAYKAAHLFTLMDGGANISDTIQKIGGGAPVASMSEGGVSISFAQNGGDADKMDAGSTKYGKMLAALIKSRPSIGVNQSAGGLV